MCGTTWVACTKPIPSHGRRSGYESWGTDSPAGSGAEPRRQTHFCKNILQINSFRSTLLLCYFRSDKRRSLVGTAQDRQCCPWLCKTCCYPDAQHESDRLVTSLVFCPMYGQLLVLRTLGGASYRTGIILVVVHMAAPLALLDR